MAEPGIVKPDIAKPSSLELTTAHIGSLGPTREVPLRPMAGKTSLALTADIVALSIRAIVITMTHRFNKQSTSPIPANS